MSSKTKIVVLKARELIYTGIFILLGILLILLLIFMFVPSHKSKKAKETSGYTQGVYSSPLKLGENELELSVTVKDGKARSISLKHLNKSIKTMYPLIEPSLNEINKQLYIILNICYYIICNNALVSDTEMQNIMIILNKRRKRILCVII